MLGNLEGVDIEQDDGAMDIDQQNLIGNTTTTFSAPSAGGGGVTVLMLWKFMPGGEKCWSLAKTINGMLSGKFYKVIY